MKAINFEGANMKVAENQEEYETLPAHVNEETGVVTSCWELTAEEVDEFKATGKIFLQQATFGHALQPVSINIKNPLL